MYRLLLIFTQIHSLECKKFMQKMSSFCHNFISNIFLNLKIFNHDQHFAESFASQILIIRPLRTKSMKHRKYSPLNQSFKLILQSVQIKETCCIVEKQPQLLNLVSIMLLEHQHASSKKGEKGQTEMLKQIKIKVSLCKKSGIHQPIGLRKDGFTPKNLWNLQNLICCQCLKLRSNCLTLLINMIFNYSPITQEQRGCG